jgi:hypothetical protein
VDLVWYSTEAWKQGLIDGGARILDKNKQGFTFGTLFYGLELLGAAWECDTHVFSVEQLNQRKTSRPKAQSISKDGGGTLGAYSEFLAGNCCRDLDPRSYCEI